MAKRDERGRFLPKPRVSQGMGEFGRRMVIRGEHTPTGTSNVIRRLALSIDQEIVLRTPVDRGRARSNWAINIGSPAQGTRGAYQPGRKLGVEEGGNKQGAIDQGRAAISASPDFVSKIFITNNLGYIADLNNGTSDQAPKNFVRLAIVDGSAKVLKTGTVRVTERG